MKERRLRELTEGTEQLECDSADLVIVGCGYGAEAEDAVFREGSARTGGFERVHSDGDEDVLRGWVENGVVEEDGVAYVDAGNDTTVGGAERGRGRGETAMGVWRGERIRLEERAPSGGLGVERPG